MSEPWVLVHSPPLGGELWVVVPGGKVAAVDGAGRELWAIFPTGEDPPLGGAKSRCISKKLALMYKNEACRGGRRAVRREGKEKLYCYSSTVSCSVVG